MDELLPELRQFVQLILIKRRFHRLRAGTCRTTSFLWCLSVKIALGIFFSMLADNSAYIQVPDKKTIQTSIRLVFAHRPLADFSPNRASANTVCIINGGDNVEVHF